MTSDLTPKISRRTTASVLFLILSVAAGTLLPKGADLAGATSKSGADSTPGVAVALPASSWTTIGGASVSTPDMTGAFSATFTSTYWGGLYATPAAGCDYRFDGEAQLQTGGSGYGFGVRASIDANGVPHSEGIQYDPGIGGYRDTFLPDNSETGTITPTPLDNGWHEISVAVFGNRYVSMVDGKTIFSGTTLLSCGGVFIRIWRSSVVLRDLSVTPITSLETVSAPATGISWLAAGDSYASGAGLPFTTQLCARGTGAGKSRSLAWALVAANDVLTGGPNKMQLSDAPHLVACSGARSAEFFQRQDKNHPAEWTPSMGPYDLVTFSFGGDDVGFASVVQACLEHLAACSDRSVRSSIRALGSSYSDFLVHVAKAAVVPGGNVLVMGYPEILEHPSLWPAVYRGTHECAGFDVNVAKLFRGWAGDLNATIANSISKVDALPPSQRNDVHVTFVDPVTGQAANGIAAADPNLFEPSAGTRHELCSGGNDAWLNGISPGHPKSRSFHPNQAGEDAMGNLAAEVIERMTWPWSRATTTTAGSDIASRSLGWVRVDDVQNGQGYNSGSLFAMLLSAHIGTEYPGGPNAVYATVEMKTTRPPVSSKCTAGASLSRSLTTPRNSPSPPPASVTMALIAPVDTGIDNTSAKISPIRS